VKPFPNDKNDPSRQFSTAKTDEIKPLLTLKAKLLSFFYLDGVPKKERYLK